MGIGITYRAKIKSSAAITQLTAEVKDICEIMEWEYQLVDQQTDLTPARSKSAGLAEGTPMIIKGIAFRPHPQSGRFQLTFAQNLKLIAADWAEVFMKGIPEEYVYFAFTKTHFAGPEVHVTVIKLLKYLEEKYFEENKIRDDSKYWETGDMQNVRDAFMQMDFIIGALHSSYEDYEKGLSNERPSGLLGKMLEIIRNGKEE